MKIIKYNLCTKLSNGDEILSPVVMVWNESNEEVAKNEAHNGEYTIEDDGTEEIREITDAERIDDLEEALSMLLSGVTE